MIYSIIFNSTLIEKRRLSFLKQTLLLALFLCICFAGKGYAQKMVTIADTNSYGNLTLYNYQDWKFSFEAPSQIKDRRNLEDTLSVSLRDYSTLFSNPKWDEYGWFELELIADSSVKAIPWIISYRGHEPINVWLNGVPVLKNGNPSKDKGQEVLARFINAVQTGINLREGSNYILIEYSSHTNSNYFTNYQRFNNGIYLILYQNYETYQRRHRAFIFGGALMLLLLLVLIHAYLAVKFKGQYHTYVALTTFFMLLHAFTTLSDTVFNWTYSYIYFFEFSYAISFLFVVYFFLIAIRRIFDLTIPWRSLTSILVLSIIVGIVSIFVNKGWLSILHSVLIILALIYGIYSLWEAKQKSEGHKIWIIATGLAITIGGSLLYVLPYMAFGSQNHVLFIVSVLLAYTGVPIALTFNVASNYATLITTLETKVRERTADLESANEYQNRFFANISHEFRTPLTISGGLVDKLMRQKESDPSKVQYSLSVVKRNMIRLDDMVNQIIDLTKSDQNHLTLNKKYYKADNLASISVESFRSLAEYHGHKFEFYPNAGDVILHADRSKVEIMINNLISNAIKFTPDAGVIEMKTSVESERFILTVQDTGPGIPEGLEEVIFERFHRIQREDVEYVEGMGVGLELSRALARLHNGEITAIPDLKAGACFKLELPVAEISAESITPIVDLLDEEAIISSRVDEEEVNNSAFDILLVEDNEDMMEYVSDTLSELGAIKKAKNGKEALALLETYTPDIIITDLMMPIMGGQELVENLFQHEQWKQIPTVVLTAKSLEEDKLNLLRIGVVDYITKPFLPEQLILKTKNLLTYYTRRKKLKLSIKADEVQTESDFLKRASTFVSKNIGNSNLSVDMLADEFSQSRRSFYRNLQLETGMTPAEFIREIRLTTAQSMVAANNTLRLEELANAVGYKSATSFRKVFEERFGKHPLG